jgi:hypothetical protein
MKNKPLGPGQIRIRPKGRTTSLKSGSPPGASRGLVLTAGTESASQQHPLRWLAAILVVVLALALWHWGSAPAASSEPSVEASSSLPAQQPLSQPTVIAQPNSASLLRAKKRFEFGSSSSPVICGPNWNTISQWDAKPTRCYVEIPQKPMAPAGKYIAFRDARASTAPQDPGHSASVKIQSSHDSIPSPEGALVFQGASVNIVVVKSLYEIPAFDRVTAMTWSPTFGLSPPRKPLFEFQPDGSVTTPETHKLALTPSPSTFVFPMDADIEFGPVVGRDTQQFSAILHDGELTSLTSKYSRHSPRGPPPGIDATVYVIGSVKNVRGPDQKDYSSLKARVRDLVTGTASQGQLDLQPTAQEKTEYARRRDEWQIDVMPIAAEYHLSLDTISERDAREGRMDVPDPPKLTPLDRGFDRGRRPDLLDPARLDERRPGERRAEPRVEPHPMVP